MSYDDAIRLVLAISALTALVLGWCAYFIWREIRTW